MRRNIGVAINTHRGQLLANGAEDDVGLTSVTVYPSKTFVVCWRLTLLEGALLLSFYTIKSSMTRGLDLLSNNLRFPLPLHYTQSLSNV